MFCASVISSAVYCMSRKIRTQFCCVAWRRCQMKTFSTLLAICVGNSPVNSPHKGLWRGSLTISLISAWTNGWVNNRDTGDLRRHRAYYDITAIYDNFLVDTCAIFTRIFLGYFTDTADNDCLNSNKLTLNDMGKYRSFIESIMSAVKNTFPWFVVSLWCYEMEIFPRYIGLL